jgi:hypothetical protein
VLLEPELLHAEEVDRLLSEGLDEGLDALVGVFEDADREASVIRGDAEARG